MAGSPCHYRALVVDTEDRGYSIRIVPDDKGCRVWARPKWPDLPIHRRHCFIVNALSEDDALSLAQGLSQGRVHAALNSQIERAFTVDRNFILKPSLRRGAKPNANC